MEKAAITLALLLAVTQIVAIVILSHMIDDLRNEQNETMARLGEHLRDRDRDAARIISQLRQEVERLSRDSLATDERVLQAMKDAEKAKYFAYKYFPTEAEDDAL